MTVSQLKVFALAEQAGDQAQVEVIFFPLPGGLTACIESLDEAGVRWIGDCPYEDGLVRWHKGHLDGVRILVFEH